MKKVIRNRIQCRICGDIIESTDVHDIKFCKCGAVFVDGGLEYLHRGASNLDNIIEMNEFSNEEEEDV